MAITEIVSDDPSLRASWIQSYYVSTVRGLLNMPTTSLNYPNPASQNVIESNVSSLVFVGPGTVNNGTANLSWAGGFVGPFLTATGIAQLYIDGATGSLQQRPIAVTSNPATFPAGSLPLAVVYIDEVARVQRIVDMRPR